MKKLSASVVRSNIINSNVILNAVCRVGISVGMITASALFSHAIYAETIVVPVGQQGNAQTTQRPSTGITKTQVKSQYGEPSGWRPAVGQPPISSWVYDGFTVYFEYDRVIHSVLTR